MLSMNTSKLKPICPSNYIATWGRPHAMKRQKVHIRRLNRSRRLAKEDAKLRKLKKQMMIIKNLKLYMENQTIIRENERLRKQALLLHQENNALLFQLQKVSRHH